MIHLFQDRKAKQAALDKTVRLLVEYNQWCNRFVDEGAEDRDLATELMYEGQLIHNLDQLGKNCDDILERRIGIMRRRYIRDHVTVGGQSPRHPGPTPAPCIRG